MTVARPFRRTCRQFADGSYSEGGRWKYLEHPAFAASAPGKYVRAFLLIQKDLQSLFDYVEPADQNLPCYSYRIHSLLLRACIEIEANCKAILRDNGYTKRQLSIQDFAKIESTHFLSAYEVLIPSWSGKHAWRSPFAKWKVGQPLPWYQAYNVAKHDRAGEFHQANFEALIDACAGLVVVLSAQFWTIDYTAVKSYLVLEDGSQDGEAGIGDFFRIRFPDIPPEHRYEFNWQKLKGESDPFVSIDYASISPPLVSNSP